MVTIAADDTTSWVEVFVAVKRKWVCLHLPSRSVDRPQLCEKHCPRNMCYLIGIENG